MSLPANTAIGAWIDTIDPATPVLIAGPTASGKSALALALAEAQGGVIVNADALQVYGNWRVLTARPSVEDEARAPHALYGHLEAAAPYSAGQWLKDVAPYIYGDLRPIIIGGTGLYLTVLTEGLANVPSVPNDVRDAALLELETRGLDAILARLDPETQRRIDTQNPARVLRAYEVLQHTGRGLADWQDATPPPVLPLDQTQRVVISAPKDWLTPRIERRFQHMLDQGALDEARANVASWRPTLPSAKAIGASELISHVQGKMSLQSVAEKVTIQTRQYAKRQRTWFNARMRTWEKLDAAALV